MTRALSVTTVRRVLNRATAIIGISVIVYGVVRLLAPGGNVNPNVAAIPRAQLFALASSGVRVGDVDPGVQVMVFRDFGCGWCAQFSSTLDTIMSSYPDHVGLVFKDFVLDTLGPLVDVHAGARCAARQGAFPEYSREAYNEQAVGFGRSSWRAIGARVSGIDVDSLAKCVLSDEEREAVLEDTRSAIALGFTITPTVLFDGFVKPGAPSALQTDSIVSSILAAKRTR